MKICLEQKFVNFKTFLRHTKIFITKVEPMAKEILKTKMTMDKDKDKELNALSNEIING